MKFFTYNADKKIIITSIITFLVIFVFLFIPIQKCGYPSGCVCENLGPMKGFPYCCLSYECYSKPLFFQNQNQIIYVTIIIFISLYLILSIFYYQIYLNNRLINFFNNNNQSKKTKLNSKIKISVISVLLLALLPAPYLIGTLVYHKQQSTTSTPEEKNSALQIIPSKQNKTINHQDITESKNYEKNFNNTTKNKLIIKNESLIDASDIINVIQNKFPISSISIDEISTETYALGTFIYKDNEAVWFASNLDDDWIITSFGYTGYFGICQNFTQYGFPKKMIPDCWDNKKKIIVDTTNPEKFYSNGLTKDDKNKIKNAFLNYIKNIPAISDYYIDKELYVQVIKNTEKHLKGMILKGGIENHSTPIFLAVKNNNDWIVIFQGQDTPLCSTIKPYNFPSNIVPECWDKDKNKLDKL